MLTQWPSPVKKTRHALQELPAPVKEPRLPTGCGSAVTGGAGVADQPGAQQSLSRRVVRTHSGSISDSQAEGGGQ